MLRFGLDISKNQTTFQTNRAQVATARAAARQAHPERSIRRGEGTMSIVFYCQSCGARFEVASRMAGKRGHCKKCGQMMSIPRAEHLASMSAMPALATAGVGVGAGAAAGAGAGRDAAPSPSIGGWLGADLSQIKLDQLTVEKMRLRPTKPIKPATPLDGLDDSKPYDLAVPLPRSSGRVSGQAAVALGYWRRQIGAIQKLFRSLGDTAYLLSVPFIVIFLIGIAVKSRSTALLGATFVVALNVGRLVAGLANMAAVPLRDGLSANRMKRSMRRVAEPLMMIALVLLAFTFIPWLSRGGAKGTIAERLKANTRTLRKEMKGELGKVTEGISEIDVEKVGAGAQAKFKKAGERVRGAVEKVRSQPEQP
jgi:hypothetical protein